MSGGDQRFEGFRILHDGREGVVVHGDGYLCRDEAGGAGRVFGAHGVEIADGQQRRVQFFLGQKGHVGVESRVAGVVDLLAAGLEQIAAGQAAGDAAAVNGLKVFQAAEGRGGPAADVACDGLDALLGQRSRQFGYGVNRGAGAFGDGHGVADVVAVGVGYQDEIGGDGVGAGGRESVPRQERVGQHVIFPVKEVKTGMS